MEIPLFHSLLSPSVPTNLSYKLKKETAVFRIIRFYSTKTHFFFIIEELIFYC